MRALIKGEKLHKIQLGVIFLLLVQTLACNKEQEEPEQVHLKLWYEQPADASAVDDPLAWEDDQQWLKALPLGNGSLGAMVFGDVGKERIQLNQESMWSGSPSESDNPKASKTLDEIRQLLFEGKYKQATELIIDTQKPLGQGSGHGRGTNTPYGSFQTLGDLWIDNGNDTTYSNYNRELDLHDAMVRVGYTQNGVNYKREIFTSHPDQVLVARFTADQTGKISFTSTINRPERYKTYTKDDQLIMSGTLSDGKGGDGLRYTARLKAVAKGGEITYKDSELVVENADEVLLFLTASTSHILEYPDYNGRDHKAITLQNLEQAISKSWDDLLTSHKQDYQEYFKRVTFNITSEEIGAIPTDKRIKVYEAQKNDRHLEELIFQYGRYLLISSSRPGDLPANLQGIWTNKIQTPWNGDYHTNINVQMNYWLANVTNLSEMHEPYFDLIESLVEPGSKTARIQYNNQGWVAHPIVNVWGYTSPGEGAQWGMHTGTGAWITTHIADHYAFTGDQEFLKRMYPVLKGSVEFFMDWLVEDPNTGELVSGPAVSPENTFLTPDGVRSQFSMGPIHDQQVIGQLFSDFLYASEELNLRNEFTKQVALAKDRLAGTRIGSDGRLMEWPEEFEEVEPGHRHISHLFALHPGFGISVETTPELAHAAKKSLDYRIEHGGGHTGWSAAWLISQYARLGEGDKAHESLEGLLSNSISSNLFGQHPPFQIDANFGATAGITEMLLQSRLGEILLLPALPEVWPTGEINGILARGGYKVDIKWENGRLLYADVHGSKGEEIIVKYSDEERRVNFEDNSVYRFIPN